MNWCIKDMFIPSPKNLKSLNLIVAWEVRLLSGWLLCHKTALGCLKVAATTLRRRHLCECHNALSVLLSLSLYLLFNLPKWLHIIYNLSSESHLSFSSRYCPFHLLFAIPFTESLGERRQREGRKEWRRREGEELQCREKLSLLKR